jgi:hypothetical protein
MTSGHTISLAPVDGGWAVMLIDGRELTRFTGPDAKRKALRYIAITNPFRPQPPMDKVRQVLEERGGRRPASSRS